MVDEDILRPDPAAIVDSLRSIGYTLETAIADIIDNSITACATQIDIEISEDRSRLYILDNGKGMTEEVLHQAMRLGGKGPSAAREEDDLGRFGLGLKTASFSQCKKLSVISKTKDSIAQRCWDLDKIVDDWYIDKTINQEFVNILNDYETGTLIVWEKIDSFLNIEGARADEILAHKLAVLRDHLSLTFHRFLEEESLDIYISGGLVQPWNPFLPWVPNAQKILQPREQIGRNVYIQPVVLPHRSFFSDADYRDVGHTKGWTQMQGFYIYRNDRLLATPGWMGLRTTANRIMKQERFYDLARVCIDITNEADRDWGIDVMKSKCTPPDYLVETLTEIANVARKNAYEVYRHRDNVNTIRRRSAAIIPLWNLDATNGKVKMLLNEDFPMIKEILNTTDSANSIRIKKLLRLIAATVPAEKIAFEMGGADSKQQAHPFEESKEEYDDFTETIIACFMRERNMTREEAIDQVNALLGKS